MLYDDQTHPSSFNHEDHRVNHVRDILCVQLRKSMRRKGQSTELAGRVSLGGPRAVATAVVKGQCRCSADADVRFYGFQINILFNLSITYQYFSMQSFRDDSAGIWIIKHSLKNWYFPLSFSVGFPNLS